MNREYYYTEHLKDNVLPGFTNGYLAKCDKILDIGAGTGFVADKLGKRVECLEPDEKAREILEEKGHTIIDGVAEDIVAGYDVYDAVVCLDVLEHIQNVGEAMKEIYRVLKPKGRVVIKVSTDQYNREWFWNDYTHVRPFTRYSFEMLLKDYNFKIDNIEPVDIGTSLNRFTEGYVAYAEVDK